MKITPMNTDTIPSSEPHNPKMSQNISNLSPTNPNGISIEESVPCCSRRSRNLPKYLSDYI
jgi:hypothetical protein